MAKSRLHTSVGKPPKYILNEEFCNKIRSFAGEVFSYKGLAMCLHISHDTLELYRSKSDDVKEACEFAINETHVQINKAIKAKCDMGDTSMLIYTAKTQLARRDDGWKEDRSITVNHEAKEKAEVLETTRVLVEELSKKNKRDH